jgi:hypothetical protein
MLSALARQKVLALRGEKPPNSLVGWFTGFPCRSQESFGQIDGGLG